jgi:outer membrane protein assembly factor BamA
VHFTGAESLDHDLLAAAIVTRASWCRTPLVALPCLVGDFDWAEVKQFLPDTTQVHEDAERLATLYEIWGYPDAVVNGRVAAEDDGDVSVEFAIDEGRPLRIRSLSIDGLDALDPPIVLPAELPLRVGEPYALPRLEALTELLQARSADRGHPYAEVEVGGDVDDAAYEADLVLTLQPGPRAVFGSTFVVAEAPIDEAEVRARLAYRPGDRFDPAAFDATARQLYDLPIVERAVVQPVGLLEGDSIIEVRVIVDARRTHGVDVEGTISSAECLGLSSFWRHRYFLGGPRVLGLGVGVSNLFAAQTDGSFPCGSTGDDEFGELDHAVEAELWQPSLFGDPRFTLQLGAFTRRQSSPNAWIERGVGGRVGLSRSLGRGLHALVDYRFERNELEASASYFCGNYGVCTAAGVDRLAQPTRLAPLQGVLAWRSTDLLGGDVRLPERRPGTEWIAARLPAWRWTARIAIDGAGTPTGSEYAFGRALVEASGTRVIGRIGELAARFRFGALRGDDVLPPQVRLYSGGVNTVRGAEQNLLGPRVLVTAAPIDGSFLCDDAVTCDAPAVDPGLVAVRPTGGDRVVEANLEARLWLGEMFQLAAFFDYGRLSGDPAAAFAGADAAHRASLLSPGIGFRLITDLGPIRVDFGYDATGARTLPLLADDGAGGVAPAGYLRFDPFEWDDPGFFRALTRRLQIHMAIGQAF